MLYKFKSKNTGDIIMLQPNGRRVLEIIGKAEPADPGEPGILLPEHMAAAIAALEAAVAREEAEQKQAVAEAQRLQQTPPRFDAISLRQRTLPFLDMLRRCQKSGDPIVWGV